MQQYNPAEKTKELEEGAARFNFNKENQTLIEHSDVSLNFTTGTAILQVTNTINSSVSQKNILI